MWSISAQQIDTLRHRPGLLVVPETSNGISLRMRLVDGDGNRVSSAAVTSLVVTITSGWSLGDCDDAVADHQQISLFDDASVFSSYATTNWRVDETGYNVLVPISHDSIGIDGRFYKLVVTAGGASDSASTTFYVHNSVESADSYQVLIENYP